MYSIHMCYLITFHWFFIYLFIYYNIYVLIVHLVLKEIKIKGENEMAFGQLDLPYWSHWTAANFDCACGSYTLSVRKSS